MIANFLYSDDLRVVLDSTPVLIIKAITGQIKWASMMAERVFNIQVKGFMEGKLIEEFMPERFRVNHILFRAKFAKNPTIRAGTLNERFCIFALQPDGTEFPVEVVLVPIMLANELNVICTIFDMRITAKVVREGIVDKAESKIIH